MGKAGRLHCITCGTALQGRYCRACGERVIDRGDLTLRRYLADLLSELLDADGRLFKTIATLVARPGRLTAEHLLGRRKPYLGPIAVFVLMNVAFFFLQPLANVNTFSSNLHSQTNWFPYSAWAKTMVEEKIAETGIGYGEYEQLYDVASENYAKTLVFLQVPLFALGLALIQLRRKRLYLEHLVFATHFYAAVLLLNVVASVGVYLYWAFELGDDFNLEIPFLVIILGYSALALREVYADGWIASVVKALVLLAIFIGAIHAFRYLLFLITYRSVL